MYFVILVIHKFRYTHTIQKIFFFCIYLKICIVRIFSHPSGKKIVRPTSYAYPKKNPYKST